MKDVKAVALRYPENAEAPFVVATGKGKLAERLLDIARKNNVPVVEDEFTANILSVQEIGTAIPEDTWEIVARIFAVVVESEKKI